MKVNVQNEVVKREFLNWLSEADGCCEDTVRKVEQAILLYQELTKNIDFRLFSRDRAISFKKSLRN